MNINFLNEYRIIELNIKLLNEYIIVEQSQNY